MNVTSVMRTRPPISREENLSSLEEGQQLVGGPRNWRHRIRGLLYRVGL
jgi:hypothetical protein